MSKFQENYAKLLDSMECAVVNGINMAFKHPITADHLDVSDELERICNHYEVDIPAYTMTRIVNDLKAHIDEELKEQYESLRMDILMHVEGSDDVVHLQDSIEELIREDERETIQNNK